MTAPDCDMLSALSMGLLFNSRSRLWGVLRNFSAVRAFPQYVSVYLFLETMLIGEKFNVQAIVDHLRRFINLDLGWPGCLVDVTLWKRSLIWLMRHTYFRRGEYLLADKGLSRSSGCPRIKLMTK